MKGHLNLIVAILAMLSLAGSAGAATYTYNLSQLGDLDHYYAYAWGTNAVLWSPTEQITGASLLFDNIRNWDVSSNLLYINLLDNPVNSTFWDNQNGGNYFAGWPGNLLHTYTNLPSNPQDLTYTFTEPQLATLGTYVANGNSFGLGIDPDCHFYNDGITLTIETSQVPEPASLLLLSTGLGTLGMVSWRKKKA